MLAAKQMPKVLRGVLTDGVDGAVIMTIEGSVLASEILPSCPSTVTETSLAAISSSIWNSYSQVNPELAYHITKFDRGSLAIAPIGKGLSVFFYFFLFFYIFLYFFKFRQKMNFISSFVC